MNDTFALIDSVLSQCDARPVEVLHAHAADALFDFETCAAGGRCLLPDAFSAGVARAAAAASALDLEDVHWPSITHPGPLVWPAVLAAGAKVDAAGADAIRAAAVGYEVTAQLANALGPVHRQFWHATTTAGTVGAAAAASLVFGLDATYTARAMAHAACVAGGIAQSLVERSGTRILYRAHAAATGLSAARAARAGLSATTSALDGPKGLFTATAPGSTPRFEPRTLAIEQLWFRIHAATGFAHTAIDAAASLGPVPREAVRSVRIVAPPAGVAMAGDLAPETREDGWWSIPYAAAVALLHGGPSALATDELHDVRDVLGRTTITAGESDLAATVIVEIEGEERSATAARPVGHPERPLNEQQRLDKWTALAVDGTAEDGHTLYELARRLPKLSVRAYLAARPDAAVSLLAK